MTVILQEVLLEVGLPAHLAVEVLVQPRVEKALQALLEVPAVDLAVQQGVTGVGLEVLPEVDQEAPLAVQEVDLGVEAKVEVGLEVGQAALRIVQEVDQVAPPTVGRGLDQGVSQGAQ